MVVEGGKDQGPRRDVAALDDLSQRRASTKERLRALSGEQRLELLLAGADLYTTMVIDLLDRKEGPPSGGHHPPAGSNAPDWRTYRKCRDMPSAAERVCCMNLPDSCTTLLPNFRVLILDEAVVRLSQLYRQGVLALNDDADINRGYRHAGYRPVILWTYGRLGAGVRKVIPSCCVWCIRDKYPDAYGQYVGFVPSRLL